MVSTNMMALSVLMVSGVGLVGVGADGYRVEG